MKTNVSRGARTANDWQRDEDCQETCSVFCLDFNIIYFLKFTFCCFFTLSLALLCCAHQQQQIYYTLRLSFAFFVCLFFPLFIFCLADHGRCCRSQCCCVNEHKRCQQLSKTAERRAQHTPDKHTCVCVCVEYLYTCAARFVLWFIYKANVAYVLACVCVCECVMYWNYVVHLFMYKFM